MVIAQRFLEDPQFAAKVNLIDDGSLLKDHLLLLKLKDLATKNPPTPKKAMSDEEARKFLEDAKDAEEQIVGEKKWDVKKMPEKRLDDPVNCSVIINEPHEWCLDKLHNGAIMASESPRESKTLWRCSTSASSDGSR